MYNDNIYLLLYKKIYNENKYFLLYNVSYNKKKCIDCYTSSRITRNVCCKQTLKVFNCMRRCICSSYLYKKK